MSQENSETRCLRDLLLARADGVEVAEEAIRVLRREDELVRAALAYPRALLHVGVLPGMFSGRDYNVAWAAAQAAEQAMPAAADAPLAPENVLAEMRRLDEARFAGLAGSLWIGALVSQPPVEVGYALDVLARELVARHQLRAWRGRLSKLHEQIDTTKNVLGLHSEVITEALSISLSPDGGVVGDVPEDMPWDPVNKTNANIVPSGFVRIDRAAGGGHGRGDLGVVGGGTNHGKCMRKGTLVVMSDGFMRKVEDVRVGDVLLGPDGGPRRVLSVNQGMGDMYEVRPTWKGKPFVVNFDHILTLVGTGGARGRSPWSGEVVDVSLREWWTWSRKKKHNFKLLRASALDFCGAEKGPLSDDPYAVGLNAEDAQAQSMGIPHAFKVAPMDARRELLAGLIDAHGSRNMTGFDYVTKSRQLADDVAFVARSLGLAAAVAPSWKRAQAGSRRQYWRVTLTGDAVTTVPCRLHRKRITARKHFRNALHVGFTVVPTGTVETFYGFTLDGDSRYLLEDFTITHNSYFAQRYLRNQARLGRNVLYVSVEDAAELMYCRMLADFSSPKLRPVHIRQKLVDPLAVEDAKRAMAAELQGRVRYVVRRKATVAEVCSIIRRHRYQCGIDSVVVDYLQAIQPNTPTNNKAADTSFVTSDLKRCFEDCGVAGWVLSQYAREAYSDGSEPGLNSCKHSGDIENEAELMVLLWRDTDQRLHAKLPKVKWGQAQGLRYIIQTDEAGCLGEWDDDFEEPEKREEKRGKGRR